jgi:acyl-CoA thioesterase FadM
MAGVSLIMADVAIEFKNELFYEESLTASVAVSDIGRLAFDLYYKLEKETNGKTVLVAAAKTGMVCFDYKNRKVAAMPEEVKTALEGTM